MTQSFSPNSLPLNQWNILAIWSLTRSLISYFSTYSRTPRVRNKNTVQQTFFNVGWFVLQAYDQVEDQKKDDSGHIYFGPKSKAHLDFYLWNFWILDSHQKKWFFPRVTPWQKQFQKKINHFSSWNGLNVSIQPKMKETITKNDFGLVCWRWETKWQFLPFFAYKLTQNHLFCCCLKTESANVTFFFSWTVSGVIAWVLILWMNPQNHINGLESLKDELSIITKAKNELEKRLQTTVIERETIFSSLEEALDRIHTLERHSREQESKLQVNSELQRCLTRFKRFIQRIQNMFPRNEF